jgi:hypothetical protein
MITRAKWTPFQTHCYLENLEGPRIEPGDHWVCSQEVRREKQRTVKCLSRQCVLESLYFSHTAQSFSQPCEGTKQKTLWLL